MPLMLRQDAEPALLPLRFRSRSKDTASDGGSKSGRALNISVTTHSSWKNLWPFSRTWESPLFLPSIPSSFLLSSFNSHFLLIDQREKNKAQSGVAFESSWSSNDSSKACDVATRLHVAVQGPIYIGSEMNVVCDRNERDGKNEKSDRLAGVNVDR